MVSALDGKVAIFGLLPNQSIWGKAWTQGDVLDNLIFFRQEDFKDKCTLPNSIPFVSL
jgi:hypothetical protein